MTEWDWIHLDEDTDQ